MKTVKKILKYIFGIVFCGFGAFCILGYILVNKSDPGATTLLVLGIISLVPGVILLIRAKRPWQPKYVPPPVPTISVPTTPTSPDENKLFTVSFEHVDPDENIPTPQGAKITFLDSEALNFWDERPTDYEIPLYYRNSAFGRNVGPALQRALAAGYLKRGDIRKSISLVHVPELKAILSEKELKVSGRKAELVQRLIDNIPPDELEELFPVSVYEITDEGIAAQEPYSLVYASRAHNLGLAPYRLIQAKDQNPGIPDEQILSKLLKQDIQSAKQRRNQTEYAQAVRNSASYLHSVGEYHLSLQYHCIHYFLWVLEFKNAYPSTSQVNRQETAVLSNIALSIGLSLDELINFFSTTIQNANPLGLATQPNLINASYYLRKGLGDNRVS